MPRTVIVTWQRRLLDRVMASRSAHETSGAAAVSELSPIVGLAHPPIGAPAVGIVVEELSAAGVELIVGIGTAGGLADEPRSGRAWCRRRNDDRDGRGQRDACVGCT